MMCVCLMVYKCLKEVFILHPLTSCSVFQTPVAILWMPLNNVVKRYSETLCVSGPSDPVHCFGFYRDQLLSATAANKIGVHSSVGENVCTCVVLCFGKGLLYLVLGRFYFFLRGLWQYFCFCKLVFCRDCTSTFRCIFRIVIVSLSFKFFFEGGKGWGSIVSLSWYLFFRREWGWGEGGGLVSVVSVCLR